MTGYFVFIRDGYTRLSLQELARYRRTAEVELWSARLSTGLFGLHTCKSGNRGKKGSSEVILALGNSGLVDLVQSGFITCPVCSPEQKNYFWDAIKEIVQDKYNINTLADFTNKKIVPFDARRLDWERILSVVQEPPNRIYVPQGLSNDELLHLRQRFDTCKRTLPPVGWYNPNTPTRFTEYKIS